MLHPHNHFLHKYLPLVTLAMASAVAQAQNTPAPATQPKPQFWFGFTVDNIPPVFGRLLQLPPGQGLIVMQVVQESPAAHAGLLPGDLLISLGDQPLTSPMQLIHAAHGEMHSADVVILREGKKQTINLVAQARPRGMRPIVGFSGPEATPIVQIGPGYLVDLEQTDKTPALRSVRTLASSGQRVMISQCLDAQGHIRRTITVGEDTYDVEPGKLDKLPADVRDLAQRMLETPQDRMRRELAALKQAVRELEAKINTESHTATATQKDEKTPAAE